MKKIVLYFAIIAGLSACTGNKETAPVEEVEQNVEEGMEEVGDSVEEMGDDVEEATDETSEEDSAY